jgi:hypothetical protein
LAFSIIKDRGIDLKKEPLRLRSGPTQHYEKKLFKALLIRKQEVEENV